MDGRINQPLIFDDFELREVRIVLKIFLTGWIAVGAASMYLWW